MTPEERERRLDALIAAYNDCQHVLNDRESTAGEIREARRDQAAIRRQYARLTEDR